MAIPGVTDVSQLTYKTTTRQYLDREGLIEYTNKIKSKIAEDITADLGEKITAEARARAAGDIVLQQSIDNLPAKAYSKITAVSGSTTTVIEASGKDNELKLKAGSNVALGVDTTNKAITINATDTKYSAATTTAPGLMSAADKVKLDGIATNANNYTLSPATSTTLGGVMVPADSGIELASDGKISLTKDKLVQMIGAFTGATATTAGQAGLVPAPAKASTSLYLKSDGTWGTPPDTVYTHPNSKVEAGTYRSVTVDAQGHVTAGTKPITLNEYGITDAYIEGDTIHLGTATITPLTSSSVSVANNTASWGNSVVVGTVGGKDLKFTMPANPNTWRSIKVNTDTTISASTLNLVAGTNIALTTITSGSVANVTIATSGLGTAAAKSVDYFAIAGHNHDSVYVKKSGDTMTGRLTASGKISVAITGYSWIGGKTVTNAAISTSSAFDASSQPSYYPILAATTGSGNVVNIGGITDNFGFYGYLKDRIANGTDWNFWVNTATGNWTSSGQIKATQFNGPATALTSKSIGSAAKPVYFNADGIPVAIGYTIEKSVPPNAVFTDTHCTTGLVTSNSATGTSNVAAANGSVYLNLKDDSTIRNSHKIVGDGAASVTSDANGTITITSTNTTYTAGTGITLSGTAFSNSGVRAISSGSANGTISVNTGGTTANVTVKGLGTAAYEAKDSFATAGHSHGNATQSSAGFMSAADKKALDNLAAGDLRALANTWQQKQSYSAAGTVEAGSTSGSGAINVTAGGIWAAGGILGNKVYNAVWNDLADCIPVDDDVELEPGRCYCFNGTNYHKSSKYLADGIIGIHSDTYGMHMGAKQGVKQMDVAVAGFVLAYVDQEYPVGTPLTCGPDGMLVKIEREDKIEYPEKIIATYWKKEPEEYWGSETQKVKVNGRKWVKIK
nr:MAG TPA_asm: hypothetical protein [Caudoviricetes sp.]